MLIGRIRAVVKGRLRRLYDLSCFLRYAAISRPSAKACVDISLRRGPRTRRRALVLGDRGHFEGGSVLSKMMRLANIAVTGHADP